MAPQHGTFLWNELATTDPEACKRFFRAVLGWSTRQVGEGGRYTVWMAGEQEAGGMLQMAGPEWEGVLPHWLAYIAVDDVDTAAARVDAHGGEVKAAPFDVPNLGRICVIADPTGAVVALMTPAED